MAAKSRSDSNESKLARGMRVWILEAQVPRVGFRQLYVVCEVDIDVKYQAYNTFNCV